MYDVDYAQVYQVNSKAFHALVGWCTYYKPRQARKPICVVEVKIGNRFMSNLCLQLMVKHIKFYKDFYSYT